MLQKVESTRYSQVIEDDMNEENCRVEEDSKIMHVDTLMQDGDIQAWPQPSPIAYPSRNKIIASPENSMHQHEGDQEEMQMSEMRQSGVETSPGGHDVQVVSYARKRSNVSSGLKATNQSSATKIRTYVKSSRRTTTTAGGMTTTTVEQSSHRLQN